MKPTATPSRFDIWYRRMLYFVLFEMAVVMVGVLMSGITSNDTIGYFQAFDNLTRGEVHPTRTPVYPLIIGPARALAGELGGKAIVFLLQAAVFYLSIGWFRKLALELTDNRKIAFLLIAVYALAPGPIAMCFLLLTDSLALSGMTLALLLTLKALNNNRKAAAGLLVLLPAMLMLRPIFLYLVIAFAILWIGVALTRRNHRVIWLTGLASCLLCVICFWLHSLKIEQATGYRGITTVAVVNNYFTVKDAGLIRRDEITDPAILEALDQIDARKAKAAISGEHFDGFTESSIIIHTATAGVAAEYFSEALRAHPAQTMRYMLLVRLPAVCRSEAIFGGGDSVELPTGYLGPNVGSTYLIFIIFLMVLIRRDIRHRQISAFGWFLAALFIGSNAVVILGAPANWSRLLMPDIPVLLLICGLVLSPLCRWLSIGNLRNRGA